MWFDLYPVVQCLQPYLGQEKVVSEQKLVSSGAVRFDETVGHYGA